MYCGNYTEKVKQKQGRIVDIIIIFSCLHLKWNLYGKLHDLCKNVNPIQTLFSLATMIGRLPNLGNDMAYNKKGYCERTNKTKRLKCEYKISTPMMISEKSSYWILDRMSQNTEWLNSSDTYQVPTPPRAEFHTLLAPK